MTAFLAAQIAYEMMLLVSARAAPAQ